MISTDGLIPTVLWGWAWGPCTLPREITAVRALHRTRQGGCHWAGTPAYWVRRCESHGYREWSLLRREDRRRDRHQARGELRAWSGDD